MKHNHETKINSGNIPLSYNIKGRTDKCIHLLKGILSGIKADNVVNDLEKHELKMWIEQNPTFIKNHIVGDLVNNILEVIEEGDLDLDAIDFFIDECEGIFEKLIYYDNYTTSIQELHGIIHGMLADGFLNIDELFKLQEWVDLNQELQGYFPYDDIYRLVKKSISDKAISSPEYSQLISFFLEFTEIINKRASKSLNHLVSDRKEIFDKNISIIFQNSVFCFTGTSAVAKRDYIQQVIESKGGTFSEHLTKKVNYLVLGGKGSNHYKYESYGSKIEAIINNSRSSKKTYIIHEKDFWEQLHENLNYKISQIATRMALKYTEPIKIPPRYIVRKVAKWNPDSGKEKEFNNRINHWALTINNICNAFGEEQGLNLCKLVDYQIDYTDDQHFPEVRKFTEYLNNIRNLDSESFEELGNLVFLHTDYLKIICGIDSAK